MVRDSLGTKIKPAPKAVFIFARAMGFASPFSRDLITP